jgi:hypothetical protein
MGNPLWLDELRQQLFELGLPRWYIERLAEEMSDHITDILEEGTSMEAKNAKRIAERLGGAGALAQAAATEYRKSFFCRNHPLLTFLVLPVPVLLILLGMSLLLSFGIGCVFRLDPFSSPSRVRVIAFGMLWIPFALSAIVFCRLALSSGQPWRWAMLSCSLLAVLGGVDALLGLSLHVRDVIFIVTPVTIAFGFSWQWRRKRRQSILEGQPHQPSVET